MKIKKILFFSSGRVKKTSPFKVGYELAQFKKIKYSYQREKIPRSLLWGISLLFITVSGCMGTAKFAKKSKINTSEIKEILIEMKKVDSNVRKQYIDRIVSLGTEAVDPLIKELDSNDVEIQESAAALLGIIADKRAVDPLIKALQGGIKRKYIAAWSLSKIHDARVIPYLIKSLEDENTEVRRYSIRALISFGKQAVDPLIEVIKHPNPNVRAGAARALGDISDKKAVEPLLSIINDENIEVVFAVSWAIGKIGDNRAVLPLIQLLNHKNKDIRINAARSLGIIGNKNAKDILEKVLNEDEEFVVREWAARALENITGNKYKYRDAKGNMVEPYNLYR